jgi:hypothetical protein
MKEIETLIKRNMKKHKEDGEEYLEHIYQNNVEKMRNKMKRDSDSIHNQMKGKCMRKLMREKDD